MIRAIVNCSPELEQVLDVVVSQERSFACVRRIGASRETVFKESP